METFKNLIGGEWVGASDHASFETRNPARSDEVLGTFPSATAADSAQAVAAAAEAFPGWRATPAPARGAILTRARDILRYFGGEGWRLGGDVLPANTADAMLFSRREPLGVVAVITPWNFPIAIPAWKIAPALVYGDTVVFKPASATPLTALRLVECLQDAGLPAGVLNFVTGSGATVGGALAGDSVVRGLTFTGSHSIGAGIYARATESPASAPPTVAPEPVTKLR